MKNYGFVRPVLDDTQYRLGGTSLPKTILQHDGNWQPYLPKYERQFGSGWDSYGCTVFGTLNCLETMMEKVYGKEYDYSERYIYNIAEVLPPGHDPHDIAEKIRKHGVINQELLPFKDNLKDFASPRPMTFSLLDKGHLWLEDYSFKHEWVYTESLKDPSKRHELIREYLKYSPLGVSVTAWLSPENGAFPSNGQPNTHWCEAFKIDDKGQVYVFDSYDQEIKILTPDHDIQFVKRYYLVDIRDNLKQQISLYNQILNLLKIYVDKFFKVSSKIVAGLFSRNS